MAFLLALAAQAATVTNDRLEIAEAEGRLKDLATEKCPPACTTVAPIARTGI